MADENPPSVKPEPSSESVPCRDGEYVQTKEKGEDLPSLDGGEGKGKAKEHKSMANRLQSSGIALLNSAIRDNVMPNVLSSQKTRGESSSMSTHSPLPQWLAESGHQGRGGTSNKMHETVRTASDSQQTAREFGSFIEDMDSNAITSTANTLDSSINQKSVFEQEALDGSDVVDLLSQPSFFDSTQPEEDVEELTPLEMARLRHTLFETGSTWPFWDQLLNFTPDFVANPEMNGASAAIQTGVSDPQHARDTWLQQWNDVLSSYTDEVWGDLGPLATAAREEIDHSTGMGGDLADTKALGRLRLILAHVRGKL